MANISFVRIENFTVVPCSSSSQPTAATPCSQRTIRHTAPAETIYRRSIRVVTVCPPRKGDLCLAKRVLRRASHSDSSPADWHHPGRMARDSIQCACVPDVDQYFERAKAAAAVFSQFTQEQTDRVVKAVYEAAFRIGSSWQNSPARKPAWGSGRTKSSRTSWRANSSTRISKI